MYRAFLVETRSGGTSGFANPSTSAFTSVLAGCDFDLLLVRYLTHPELISSDVTAEFSEVLSELAPPRVTHRRVFSAIPVWLSCVCQIGLTRVVVPAVVSTAEPFLCFCLVILAALQA